MQQQQLINRRAAFDRTHTPSHPESGRAYRPIRANTPHRYIGHIFSRAHRRGVSVRLGAGSIGPLPGSSQLPSNILAEADSGAEDDCLS